MNKGIYRLVFNAARAVWMAVSEYARGHVAGSGKRRRHAAGPLVLILFFAGVPVCAWALGADVVPTGLTVTTGANTTINAPVVNPANAAGQLLAIRQGDAKAIMQGNNFNIGSASEVRIDSTTGAHISTLVRISGPKSEIDGTLTSNNGDVYLLNQNGILFGNGARVNVHGLVASALDLADSDFLNDLGHLFPASDSNRPAYVWQGNGDQFATTLVQVDPDARIKAQLGGSVMLFAPTVINKGSIETSEGQVVMAAGAKVYLSVAPDPNDPNLPGQHYASDSPYQGLAGVLVEVDPYQERNDPADAKKVTFERTGTVTNDTMGRILAERGNVTMASFLVNQRGRVTATTSVAQKGSIRLLAADTETTLVAPILKADGSDANSTQTVISSKRGGTLEFGPDSVTMVLPEAPAGAALAAQHLAAPQAGEPAAKPGEKSYLDTVVAALADKGLTATDEQVFSAPTLQAVGRNVSVLDGSAILVPGGNISLSAQAGGETFNAAATAALPDARLYLGSNTLIDASGLRDVSVSMDRNFVQELLTLNDLKDDPLNKDDFLYRKQVWFDIRNPPDERVADLAAYIKQVPRGIDEKLTTAGTVRLQSEGDLVQRAGSVVDVSGGSVKYTDGTHKETWLVDANGKAYALGNAPADTVFTGFLGGGNFRTYAEQGYTEGKAAGSLTINTFGMALDGALRGSAIYGEQQRNSANLGGSLVLGNNGGGIFRLAGVDIVNGLTPLDSAFTKDSALPASRAQTALLDAGMLNRSGFENVAVYSDGKIRDYAQLNLPAGGVLSLTGSAIEVHDDIVARSGAINLNSLSTTGVDSGVQLDVSGLWVNDYLNAGVSTGRILAKGGSVSISSGAVTLGAGSLVDVSGGAWMQAGGKVSAGNAGSINIAANGNVAPQLQGELRGYSLARGGSLAITAPFVTVGASSFGDAREFLASPAFFQRGGFTGYALTGRDGVLVRSGTDVEVSAQNYQLRSNALLAQTGAHVQDVADVVMLPDYLRYSTSLSLSTQSLGTQNSAAYHGVARGSVIVEQGAVLHVEANGNGADAGDSIALSAWDNLLQVDGTLQAAGGNISLTMNGDPASPSDDGYNAGQAIWLGSTARLLAGGYARYQPDASGLRKGAVHDGGSVNINAKKGYVVAQSGSLIDVSGVAGTFDTLQYVSGIPRYLATRVVGNGGAISLAAREGMLIDAGLLATSSGGLGGTLDVSIGRGSTTSIYNTPNNYPGTPGPASDHLWNLTLTQGGSSVPGTLHPGDALDSSAPGLARISAATITAGGFSDVGLKSAYGLNFEGDVSLAVSRALRIEARDITATPGSLVTLSAPAVTISDTDVTMRPGNSFTAPDPWTGSAKLAVYGQMIDLRGNVTLSGFSAAAFTSSGDIRLNGFTNSETSAPSGMLRATGELDFTARQIYPTSLNAYTIAAEGDGGTVRFAGNGASDTAWSAGGSLTVQAETIEQGGVLKAPLGTIDLQASKKLELLDGSVTSVSTQGALIPFGYTSRDGQDYLYDFGTGTQSLTALPDKAVRLSAPVVNQNSGSIVDVSGGGDLYAYEWVPGTGGSADVLAAGAGLNAFGAGTTAVWAVLPQNNQTFASYDTQYWQGSSVKPGDAVYLSGVTGLAAGYYTLLPARYALLPGAYLVSAVNGYQDMPAGQAVSRTDGSSVVSGYLAAYTQNGYVQSGRTAGFDVRPGSDAHKLAEYQDSYASQRFAATPEAMQMGDAGRYSIAASTSLVLDGILRAVYAASARGAEVDIAAPRLMVVQHGAAADAGYLALDESNLAGMNAASLLLGGTRSGAADGVTDSVNVSASEVRVGAGATLLGPEIILAATDKVWLESGSTVQGSGSGSGSRNMGIGQIADANHNAVDGDGALLRVSGGSAAAVTRSNADRSHGDLVVDAGAQLQADGSMLLDATRNVHLNSTPELGAGAALAVAAGRISLGQPDSGASVTDGLWLTQSQLGSLATADSLTLHSYSTLDMYGAASLGSSTLDLTLQAAGIAGYDNTGRSANITARQLTLANSDNVAFAAAQALADGSVPAPGSGNLQIDAAAIVTGQNTFRVAGFSQSTLQASGDIIAKNSSALDVDGALTLSANRVTAAGAANQTFQSQGALTIAQNGVFNPSGMQQSVGASLKFSGSSVTHQGSIELPGGSVSMEATGTAASDDVTLAAGSQILAQGATFTLYDQSVALPAGSVALTSQSGNIHVADGALVNVSAAPGGDAGKLSLHAAKGAVDLRGAISAAALAGSSGNRGAGGQVDVDAGHVNDFSSMLAHLQDFSGTQSYRVRNGDVTIGSSDNVQTSHFSLAADTGAIAVQGTVDASGDKGGSIELYAKNDLAVNRGAKLLARGLAVKQSTAGTTGDGGSVVLSSDSGIVSAQADDLNGVAGALIDVSGDQLGSMHGAGGSVILRAARTGSGAGTGVNVNTAATAAVTGAAHVAVEAVKVYQASAISTALENTIASDTNAFAGYIAANPPGFGRTRDGMAAAVTPGVEVRSSGDLTLGNDWIIGSSSVTAPQMPGGGILTLRAAGNLLLNNNLGYEQYAVSGNTVSARTGSWSYRLVAGADAGSVDPETVQAGVGSVKLANNKYVRTGSGFIHVDAGQDISLGSGAAIYSEGVPDTAPSANGFTPIVQTFSLYRELYPAAGGDVSLNASGDIYGQAATSQTVNSWLYRATANQVSVNPQLRWWPRFDLFKNGVGALGGGDVSVTAGGAVHDLQFSAADNGRMGGDKNSAANLANLTLQGGGDVSVNANKDITNALLFAGKGVASASAGGALNAQFQLMDGSARAYAAGNLDLTGVSNNTVMKPGDLSRSAYSNYFYSYGANSTVSAISSSGNVKLEGAAVYPSTLLAAAPNGDIYTGNVTLFPDAQGNATLLAGHDLAVQLNMSDADPSVLPRISTQPVYGSSDLPDLAQYAGSSAHAPGLLHAADAEPVRFYAAHDVNFNPSMSSIPATVTLPKQLDVMAGNDVVDPNLVVQNLSATDISLIDAGGSIRYTQASPKPDGSIDAITAGIQVAGPGRLHLIAAKDIDLGTSNGIRSVGDQYNPYLAAAGADIMVQPGAGAQPDYAAMIADYIDPASAGAYASTYLPQLADYMRTRNANPGLSETDALAAFKALDKQHQAAFVDTVFFDELRAGGRDAIDPNGVSFGDYTRSQQAILRMFPGFTTNSLLASQQGSLMTDFSKISAEAVPHPGNLNLFYSQIRSERGGRIELLVPGGMVNAGLAVSGALNKPATDLGIVSVRGGDVDAMVRNDFQVNQSRVFTLGGSDLMLFSALANIDAGRGAKTSSATPPPVLRIKNGQVYYDYSAAVSGSGIAALTATGGAPGTVDLFAPYGEINAGEAGIRSAGNINLGAARIVGADNITAGGVTAGVPVAADTSGLSLGIGSATDPTSAGKSGDQLAQAQSAQPGANQDSFLPTLISVEVIGLGDEAQDEKKKKKEERMQSPVAPL